MIVCMAGDSVGDLRRARLQWCKICVLPQITVKWGKRDTLCTNYCKSYAISLLNCTRHLGWVSYCCLLSIQHSQPALSCVVPWLAGELVRHQYQWPACICYLASLTELLKPVCSAMWKCAIKYKIKVEKFIGSFIQVNIMWEYLSLFWICSEWSPSLVSSLLAQCAAFCGTL